MVIKQQDDCDLHKIDHQVKHFICDCQKEIESLKQQIDDIIPKVKRKDIKPMKYKYYTTQIKKISQKIKDIMQQKKLKLYNSDAKKYLSDFDQIIKLQHTLTDADKLVRLKVFKRELIIKYSQMVKKYIPVKFIPNRETIELCSCGKVLDNVIPSTHETYMCGYCYAELPNYRHDDNEVSEVSPGQKKTYSTKGTFSDKLLRFQGKIDVTFEPLLFEKLDEYFSRRGKLKGDEVKKLSKEKRHKNYSLSDLYNALKDIRYPKHYRDIHRLAHEYWGWHLHDLGRYESLISEQYNQFQNEFTKVKGSRNSSLNADIVLMILLHHNGYDVDRRDFKQISTENIDDEYKDIINKIFDRLNWKKIDLESIGRY